MFQAYELDRAPRRNAELMLWAMISALALSAAGFAAMRFSTSSASTPKEKSVDVSFRPPPPPPEPAKIETPPPPPPKKVVVPKPVVALEVPVVAPVAAAAAAPMVAPKEVPKEKAPTAVTEIVAAANVAVGGTGDGSGTEVGGSAANDDDESPAPARAKSGHAGPVNLPEDAEPPEAAEDNELPEYPDVMRETGQEATVILKIVIETNGNVSNVLVLKGDEPFVSAAINAVKRWHYEPATLDGMPISVFRIVKIPFRLKS